MKESDRIVSAQSANRDVPKPPPGPKQVCSDVVNISIFFDGTGNNKDVDGDVVKPKERNPKKWSNPARIWRSAQLLAGPDTANYAIYVPGVGTPYDEPPVDWIDEKLMSFQDGKVGGMGAGAGGTRRTDAGHVRVNDQLLVALSKSATKMNLSLAPYVEKGKPANIKELARALQNHGLVTVINFSIFGFSRGAALARAFSNEMIKQTKLGPDGVRRYNGMPIRLNFMGLFDTVASFGLPATNMDTPFCEKNLVVPAEVERCVHYIAGHELRYSFPVDLIRKNGKIQPNWTEIVYPGAHSDVGGGYLPTDQGMSNNYARIPMRDMMREAVKSGVRLIGYDDFKENKAIFVERFEIESKTLAAYQQYMGQVGTHATVEDAVTAHMKALYAGWGTMTRRKIPTPDLIDAANRAEGYKNFSHPGIAREAHVHFNSVHYEPKTRGAKGEIMPMVRAAKGKSITHTLSQLNGDSRRGNRQLPKLS